MADALAQVHPAPNPRDNTGSCYVGGTGCVQLVTTDAVSVYQWPDEATAKRWVDGVGADNATRVGAFVLNYGGTEQKDTAVKTRKDWGQEVAAARGCHRLSASARPVRHVLQGGGPGHRGQRARPVER